MKEIEYFKELNEHRFQAEKMARELASKNIDARLEKLNELRSQVIEDRALYLTKDKNEMQMVGVDSRLKVLEMSQSRMYGIIAGASIVTGIVTALITTFII